MIKQLRKLIADTQTNEGFTLPVILIISLTLLVIGLSMLQSTYSIRNSLDDQYYNRTAKEAAQSGAGYASYCLSANNFNQTWGPFNSKPNLTQGTDCAGATNTTPASTLITGTNIRSRFTVGDLETRSDGAIVLSSTGYAELTRGSGTVWRTYTATIKQVVRWKTYKASVSASGTSKTCAIVTSELYCWGKNSNGSEDFSGQLGDGTTTNSTVPVKVVQDAGVLANKVVDDVVSAQYHSCALATGKVYCWGKNTYGELGNGTTTDSSRPVEVQGALLGKTVTKIGASGNTSCAIAAGKIYCWGMNYRGSVGANTTTTPYTSPTLVAATGGANGLASTYTATELSSSGSRSFNMCAIADSKAYCWGNNETGQVGNGVANSTNVIAPTKVVDTGVLSGKTVTAISQDGYYNGSPAYTHVCVVASGKAYCWGDNGSGQLGNASTTDSSVPVAVSTSGVLSGLTVQDIVVGLQHSCALANSKIYCWGNNGSGMLGTGNYTTYTSPIAVKANATTDALYGKTITAIGGGANRGCALADFTSYCWGLNSDGQLGDGTTTTRNVPTESVFLRPKAPAFIF